MYGTCEDDHPTAEQIAEQGLSAGNPSESQHTMKYEASLHSIQYMHRTDVSCAEKAFKRRGYTTKWEPDQI